MQEIRTSSAALSRILRENPAIFGSGGGWKISTLHEPQVSSHNTRIYQVDHMKVHVKFFERTLGRTNVTYDPRREMEAEYAALKEFEKRGFSSGRYQVVRALGTDEAWHCALATVYTWAAHPFKRSLARPSPVKGRWLTCAWGSSWPPAS